MRLPYLKDTGRRTKKTVFQFRGVNYSEAVQDGQFEDCRNLSSQLFPCLSQRQGRERGKTYNSATAVHCKNGLIVVDGTELIHNGERVGTVSPGKKHIVDINTKVVIFPDKVMYDASTKEFRSLEAEYTSGESAMEFVDEKNLKVHLGSYRAEITGSGQTGEIAVKKSDTTGEYVQNVTAYDYKITDLKLSEESGALSYTNAGKVLAYDVQVGDLFVAAGLGMDGVTSYGRITKINSRSVTEGHSAGPSSPVIYVTTDFKSFDYDRYEVRGTHYRFAVSGSGTIRNVLSHQVVISGIIAYSDYVYDYKFNSLKLDVGSGEVTAIKGDKVKIAYVAVGDYFAAENLGIDGVTKWGQITNVETTEPDINGYVYKTFKYNILTVESGSLEEFVGFEEMNFRAGDTVEISGCVTYPQNNKMLTIRGITKTESDAGTLYGLTFDQGSFTSGTEAGAVTIKRSVPALAVICEQDNRIFGAEGNTIYVSALGDPTNFYTLNGSDIGSYQVAVATEGEFTGCIGFGSSVLFFKEDCMHKLMGSYPSEYTLFDYTIPGVLNGSEASLWNINEAIYYHGREGIYRYTGGTPELITAEFGLRRFDTASAGAQGDRYYISMRDKHKNEWGLWVYDILLDIWLQEDNTQAISFARDGGKLYYIDGAAGDLVLTNPDSSDEEVEWSATTCRIDEVYLNRKCYSRLFLRVDLEEDAELKVEISCDDGAYREVSVVRKAGSKTAVVPVMPNRCDNFRIRMTGRGKVKLRSLEREYNVESEY